MSVVSILTGAHCLCCFYDFDLTHCQYATTHCKRSEWIQNPMDDKALMEVPVNQHTGQHWTQTKQPPREEDNSISIKMGSKSEEKAKGYNALDAYIMTSKIVNGKLAFKEDGVYDIGVVRLRMRHDQYVSLGIINLELPNT